MSGSFLRDSGSLQSLASRESLKPGDFVDTEETRLLFGAAEIAHSGGCGLMFSGSLQPIRVPDKLLSDIQLY